MGWPEAGLIKQRRGGEGIKGGLPVLLGCLPCCWAACPGGGGRSRCGASAAAAAASASRCRSSGRPSLRDISMSPFNSLLLRQIMSHTISRIIYLLTTRAPDWQTNEQQTTAIRARESLTRLEGLGDLWCDGEGLVLALVQRRHELGAQRHGGEGHELRGGELSDRDLVRSHPLMRLRPALSLQTGRAFNTKHKYKASAEQRRSYSSRGRSSSFQEAMEAPLVK